MSLSIGQKISYLWCFFGRGGLRSWELTRPSHECDIHKSDFTLFFLSGFSTAAAQLFGDPEFVVLLRPGLQSFGMLISTDEVCDSQCSGCGCSGTVQWHLLGHPEEKYGLDPWPTTSVLSSPREPRLKSPDLFANEYQTGYPKLIFNFQEALSTGT